MAEEIRRCWAYNKEGSRCDHPAGHPGDHAITQTWTDTECQAPSGPATLVTHMPVPNPVPIPEPAPAIDVSRCVACSHKHRGNECKCGCYEFIG
jgi:hypothetical protein